MNNEEKANIIAALKTAINCIENDLPHGMVLVLDTGESTSTNSSFSGRPIYFTLCSTLQALDSILAEDESDINFAMRSNLASSLHILAHLSGLKQADEKMLTVQFEA